MIPPVNRYHFRTRWHFPGNVSEAYDLLSDPLAYPDWWRGPRLRVREIAAGDRERLHQIVEFEMKAVYTLRWQSRSVEADRPHRFSFESTGDFVGRGVWTFRQEAEMMDIVFDWNVAAEKPLLRRFSFLLRPLFSANHHRVMRKWKESLQSELAHRAHLK